LCKKSGNIIAYSAGDVDLIRTFGESAGTEIGQRYEKRGKPREYRSGTLGIRVETLKEVRAKERARAAKLKEQKEAAKAGCYQECRFNGGSPSLCADRCTPSTYVHVDAPDAPDSIFIYK